MDQGSGAARCAQGQHYATLQVDQSNCSVGGDVHLHPVVEAHGDDTLGGDGGAPDESIVPWIELLRDIEGLGG